MLNQLGKKIKVIRSQKGISLNSLASRLGVSPAYLSNLENGKTESIQLSFLNRLQEELNVPLCSFCSTSKSDFDSFRFRVDALTESLAQLKEENPNAANYLIAMVEQGVNQLSSSNGYTETN